MRALAAAIVAALLFGAPAYAAKVDPGPSIQPTASVAHEYATGLPCLGCALNLAQPSFGDLSGSLAASQCPAATTSAVGCVEPDGTTITISAGKISAAGGGLTVGTTTIGGGTSGDIEYNNAGVLGEYATTGSGSVVLGTGPTLSGATLSGATTLPGSGSISSAGVATLAGVTVGGTTAPSGAGVYTPTAGEIAFGSGGAEVAYISAAGSIYGAVSKTYGLHAVSASATSATLVPNNSDTTTGIGSAGTGYGNLIAGNTTEMEWTASGVTIGSPTGGAEGSGTINMAQCYVNGVACATGSSSTPAINVVVFTASGTYTPSSGVKAINLQGCAGGGSGGSGAVIESTSTQGLGGGGGGGGECTGPAGVWVDPADIGASAAVTIGSTASGGAAVTASTTTSGNNGAAGGNVTVVNASSKTLLALYGGGGGGGGSSPSGGSSGGSGGVLGAGGSASGSTAGTAGAGNGVVGATPGNAGGSTSNLGIGGAGSTGTYGAPATAAGNGYFGAGGGGGGGGVSATCTAETPTNGGYGYGNLVSQAAGGTSSAPNGGNGTTYSEYLAGGGGGGGWGGPKATANAGTGGNGANGGAGGGGGTTCAASGSQTSGAGGAGSAPFLVVREYF